ncbi:hypothetical protein [Streptomyces sulfonofaciens]|nr:hypothetical protein [Streptomyces sulfonofaciens]
MTSTPTTTRTSTRAPLAAHGTGRVPPRSGAVLAGLCAAVLALSGCGGQKGGSPAAGSVPDGWGTLATSGVSVSYPKAGSGSGGYTVQTAGERSKYNAAAAERTEHGVTVSLITIQLGFTRADTAEDAAIAAEAGIQLGSTIRSTRKVKLAGTGDARRIDFEFGSTGEDRTPPKGTRIEGVILTGLDSKDRTFAVRVDARKGTLPDADLKRIVDSIEVH